MVMERALTVSDGTEEAVSETVGSDTGGSETDGSLAGETVAPEADAGKSGAGEDCGGVVPHPLRSTPVSREMAKIYLFFFMINLVTSF